MATSRSSSHGAFNEVRGLLNRMERSIEEARDRRLGAPRPQQSQPAAGAQVPVDLDTVIGGEADVTAMNEPRESASDPAPDAFANGSEGEASSSATPLGEWGDAPRTNENRQKYGRAQPLRRPQGWSGSPGWKD